MNITRISEDDQPLECDEHPRERAVFWISSDGSWMKVCRACALIIVEKLQAILQEPVA